MQKTEAYLWWAVRRGDPWPVVYTTRGTSPGHQHNTWTHISSNNQEGEIFGEHQKGEPVSRVSESLLLHLVPSNLSCLYPMSNSNFVNCRSTISSGHWSPLGMIMMACSGRIINICTCIHHLYWLFEFLQETWKINLWITKCFVNSLIQFHPKTFNYKPSILCQPDGWMSSFWTVRQDRWMLEENIIDKYGIQGCNLGHPLQLNLCVSCPRHHHQKCNPTIGVQCPSM